MLHFEASLFVTHLRADHVYAVAAGVEQLPQS